MIYIRMAVEKCLNQSGIAVCGYYTIETIGLQGNLFLIIIPYPVDVNGAYLLISVGGNLPTVRIVVVGGHQNVFGCDRPLLWHRHNNYCMTEVRFGKHKLNDVSWFHPVKRHLMPKGAGALIFGQELVQVHDTRPGRSTIV